MDDLRLSLLAIGIVVLIAVYVLTMRTVRRRDTRQFRLGGDVGAMDPDRILNDYVNEPESPPHRDHGFDPRNPDGLEPQPSLRARRPGDERSTELSGIYAQEPPPEGGGRHQDPVQESATEVEPEQGSGPEPIVQSGEAAPARHFEPTPEPEPVSTQAPSIPAPEVSQPVHDVAPAVSAEETVPEMLLIFYLMSRGEALDGGRIEQAASSHGLEQSPRGTYDLYLDGDDGRRRQLLGLANALEPGVFDFSNLEQFSTPGLVLYMQLPGPLPSLEAFERMLQIANGLSALLDAEVLDESRAVLSHQTVARLRERIHDHDLRRQIPGPGHETGLSSSPSP